MNRFLIVVLLLSLTYVSKAQTGLVADSAVSRRISENEAMPLSDEKREAVEFARNYNIPVRTEDQNGRIIEIRRINAFKQPEYLTTDNKDAAETLSTNKVQFNALPGFNLNGNGIVVGVWDGGKIRSTHVEFDSRAYGADGAFELAGHSTHVAGTIGASGKDENALGMAPACMIEGYNWDNDNQEMNNAAEDGLLLSNHSYGFIQGFDYNSEERRWQWYGAVSVSQTEDYKFGFYGTDARTWDRISRENPYYLIVKSAGNDRDEGPGAGGVHYVWDDGWKESNQVRDTDGYPDGFDCIGMQSTSKNILTVGAVKDIEGGYVQAEDVEMTSFSSFGPTDDGRIKPDIVGNGYQVYSPYYESDNDYATLNGTSMAAPSVTGSMVLIQQLFHDVFQSYMRSSSLKGLVLHTADDAGKAGPDYKFGWGLLNTKTACELILDYDAGDALILEDSLTAIQEKTYIFYKSGEGEMKATLCWTDPQGHVPDVAVDPVDLQLVNDLDMRIQNLQTDLLSEPFILLPEFPDSTAGRGDNFRDNIEQIVDFGESGFYRVIINTKNVEIIDSLQYYSLIVSGAKLVYLSDSSNVLHENNGAFRVTDAPVVPSSSSFNWLIEPENGLMPKLSFDYLSLDQDESLFIYDGPNDQSAVLAAFSGNLSNPDTVVNASGNSIFVQYSSTAASGSKGFKVDYCTTAPVQLDGIFGDLKPCLGQSAEYSIDLYPGIDYLWELSGDQLPDTNMLARDLMSVDIQGNPFSVQVTSMNNCGSTVGESVHIVPIDTKPSGSFNLQGDTLPCAGIENHFEIDFQTDVLYKWMGPEGWDMDADGNVASIIPLDNEATIEVLPYNSCGTSDTVRLRVMPVNIPEKNTIRCDDVSPCQKTEQVFYILEGAEKYDYKWGVDEALDIVGSDTLTSALVSIGEVNSAYVYLDIINKCGSTELMRKFNFSQSPESPVVVVQESMFEKLDEFLITNSDVFSSISWIRNDSILSGARDSSLIISSNGQYAVSVTNSQGCAMTYIDEDLLISVEDLRVSIWSAGEGEIKIYNETPDDASVRFYSLTGEVVEAGTVYPGENVYKAPEGLFVIEVRGKDGLAKKELIYNY